MNKEIDLYSDDNIGEITTTLCPVCKNPMHDFLNGLFWYCYGCDMLYDRGY